MAYAEYDRYLSQLEDDYLRGLAKEVRGQYVEGTDTAKFFDFVHDQPPGGTMVAAKPKARV